VSKAYRRIVGKRTGFYHVHQCEGVFMPGSLVLAQLASVWHGGSEDTYKQFINFTGPRLSSHLYTVHAFHLILTVPFCIVKVKVTAL
jgi:hypothetical protein